MQAPNDIQWADFYRKLKTQTGIDFNLYKQNQLQRQILMLGEQRRMPGFEALVDLVLKSEDERRWFLDKLAINVTEVFRNPELWRDLEKIVKHELADGGRSIRAWSAGCSTGAEAYSLAAVLDKFAPGRPHKIVCTDIDETAMAQAKRGFLNRMEARMIPQEFEKYFEVTEDGANVIPKLKDFLTFQKHNLLADSYGVGYDLIICRNVLIYFVDEAKDQIFQRFYNALRPGGYLFLGSSERIYNTREIGFECPRPYFYKKPSEEKVWRNAS
ncbi:MAG: protein-glutamate O-methyltransferase CheR [Armatimonadetes bacterium]|nr:protein-glutamate O-methyltransferase CheR [Armatimonadota bacterium]